MKILFVTGGGGIDYLNDLMFIGLVNNGHEVLDTHHLWYTEDITPEQSETLYGRGFTISGNLSDRSSLDRSDDVILEKIRDHYFDCVVYGSVWRCYDYYDEVMKSYKPNEIIILDGEGTTKDLQCVCPSGIYFKRELLDYRTKCLPVSFSIPEKKMISSLLDVESKNRIWSHITPKDTRTYIYTKEEDYYGDYRQSLLGTTIIKDGADCLRHYEIIGNGCLPYFPDFRNISKMTMVNWPVDLQIEANIIAEQEGDIDMDRYSKVLNEFFNYAKDNLTSEIVSERMLGKLF